MKVKRIDGTRQLEFIRLMEERDWTLVITERSTGHHATVVGEGLPKLDPTKFLPLEVERPTERQALEVLREIMFRDGYFD